MCARILVKGSDRHVELIVSQLTDDVALLNVPTEFTGGSAVEKTDFP
ncbi:MAG: hypothetical protein QOG67_2275, partial [Verrucomicrobiota bacterium]